MGKRTNTAKWMENQNRWQINVQKDGQRRSFTSSKPGRTGQREANAKADAWLDDGLSLPVKRRVSDIYPLFLEDLKARTSKSNWKPLNQRMAKWALPLIGSVKVDELTDQHFQNVVNKAFRTGHLTKKGLCNVRGDLSAFAKFCRKNKLSTFRPEDVDIPAQAVVNEKPVLQPNELKTLLSEDFIQLYGKKQVEPLIYGFRLQVLTGLRPGELLGLRKSDKHGFAVHIRRSINDLGEITSGKNGNAHRTIILTPLAVECWEKQAALFPQVDELFPLTSQKQYRCHLERYCRQHSLTPVTPYCLRHTFVSVVKTLPEGMVKSLVGHSKQMDTFGVYGHAMDGDQLEVNAALSARFEQLLGSEK